MAKALVSQLSPQRRAVIAIIARQRGMRPELVEFDTEFGDGYSLSRLVMKELKCSGMLCAPKVKVSELEAFVSRRNAVNWLRRSSRSASKNSGVLR